MDPERTIRRSIWRYPTVTPNRAAALHHLFYVIGNGFEWNEDGEMVDCWPRTHEEWLEDERERLLRQEESRREHALRWKELGLSDERFLDIFDELRQEEQEVRDNIDTAVRDMTFGRNVYPRCREYAKVYNYPDNITPEWEAARKEAFEFFEPLLAEQEAEDAVEAVIEEPVEQEDDERVVACEIKVIVYEKPGVITGREETRAAVEWWLNHELEMGAEVTLVEGES